MSSASLSTPGSMDALAARLETVTPDAARQWGRMSAHQMLCHLTDAFLVVRGDRPAARPIDNVVTRTVVKYIALRTSLPWMKGAPTMPECDAEKQGTAPAVFAEDRAKAIRVLREFASPSATPLRHPLFGPMSHEEWMIWAYRHADHHLRQFGK